MERVSIPQRELFEILIQVFPDAELEYKIGGRVKKKGFHVRWADIGIPSLKIDFEYDGWAHKTMSFEDNRRDEELNAQGWKTIRINKKKLALIQSNFQIREFHKKNNSLNLKNKDEFLDFISKLDRLVGKEGLCPLILNALRATGNNTTNPTNPTNYTEINERRSIQ